MLLKSLDLKPRHGPPPLVSINQIFGVPQPVLQLPLVTINQLNTILMTIVELFPSSFVDSERMARNATAGLMVLCPLDGCDRKPRSYAMDPLSGVKLLGLPV
ncbi:uncharacterized protein RSE6_12032 [Rhynchosporium secalis]|uniref:Uncharacterized protein n=1 Tax=Rhynchosporium secalis TaxID=38038 RepID=A0A1E1MPD2_RHYSE|nr:uncharacterized protein RSE6_12032 [Rhynchosporium secalis]